MKTILSTSQVGSTQPTGHEHINLHLFSIQFPLLHIHKMRINEYHIGLFLEKQIKQNGKNCPHLLSPLPLLPFFLGFIPARLCPHYSRDMSSKSPLTSASRSNSKFSVLILLIRLLDRNDHSLFPETSFSLASGIPLSPGCPPSLATPSSLLF